jgi:hypothetical protein
MHVRIANETPEVLQGGGALGVGDRQVAVLREGGAGPPAYSVPQRSPSAVCSRPALGLIVETLMTLPNPGPRS